MARTSISIDESSAPPDVDVLTTSEGQHFIKVDMDGVDFYLPGYGAASVEFAQTFAVRLFTAAGKLQAMNEVRPAIQVIGVDVEPNSTDRGVMCDDRR